MRALRLLLQFGGILLLAVWVISQTGTFEINFGVYHLAGDTPFLALVTLLAFIILLFLHRCYLWVLSLPKILKHRRREINLRQGHTALARALSALVSGDHTLAYTQATRAQKLLPEFPSVPNALLATAAHHTGQPLVAQRALQNLLTSEARDLGVRGLIQAALSDKNWVGAMTVAREAFLESPKTASVARLLYDLECQCGAYAEALKRQSFLIKRRVLSREMAKTDAMMLHTALGRIALRAGDHRLALYHARRAYRTNPAFTPAACDLIDLYRGFGRTWAAMRVLKRSFVLNPHPDLMERHEQMAPQTKNLARRLRYHENFLALCPAYAPAQLLLARVAMEESLWGETRAYLAVAERLGPTRAFYQFRAQFNSEQGDQKQVQQDLEQAMIAPSDPVWYCRVTHKTFDTWEPLVMPEHLFGTIVWGVPGDHITESNRLPLQGTLQGGINRIL